MPDTQFTTDTDATKPDALTELTKRDQWVGWITLLRPGGKVDKVPANPHTGKGASVTNPDTWGSRAQVEQAQQRWPYIVGKGTVFTDDDPFAGGDLDNCYDPETKTLTPMAQEIVDLLNSYTEISPSGRGVKMWFRGKLTGRAIKHAEPGVHIEIYDRKRFLTFTGQHLPGTPECIHHRQPELDLICERYCSEGPMRGRGRVKLRDLMAALDLHKIPYRSVETSYGTVLRLDECLTSENHDDGGYFTIFDDDTALYRCFHNTCADKGWAEAAAVLGLPTEEIDPTPFSDEANAERLVKLHGGDWRYCKETKTDYLWDGQRFAKDRTGRIEELAKDVGRSYLDEAKRDGLDSDKRKQLSNWAAKSLEHPRLVRMVAMARVTPRIAVIPEQLDADRWLLNTPSGTVNFITGGIYPHDRADLITRITRARYDSVATNTTWETFLRGITEGWHVAHGERQSTPDEAKNAAEIRSFLQRLAGMSATGDASEEVAPFLHGPPASGKSTLVAGIGNALGDYAMTTDFETFLKRSQPGGIRSDLVRLNKARMVASVEVEDGRELASALFKRLTGGDTQTARGLYASEIVLEPTQTYWLVANHAPGMDSADAAIWRRLLRIPFPHEVPEEKRDPAIKRAITNPAVCGPAILAWIVQGALDWRRLGLNVPDTIRAATKELREDMDSLANFFEDECEFDPGAMTKFADLWDTYSRWVQRTRQKTPLKRREFGDRLTQRGCDAAKGTANVTIRRGIRLRWQHPQEENITFLFGTFESDDFGIDMTGA